MNVFRQLPDLDEKQVRERLALSKGKPDVVDELYDFGDMLLRDAVARIAAIDSKATSIAGYAGGLVTLLIATSGIWASQSDWLLTSLTVVAGVAAAVAGACAMQGIALQQTQWFKFSGWLQQDCLQDRDRLRRYHILTMWQVIKSHYECYVTKIDRVRRAQKFLVVAGALLAISFLQVAYTRTPLKHLGLDGWQIVSGWLHRLLY
jgi:hypothetical protein